MKTFVIDTCVLVDHPSSIFTFGDNDVIIPLIVLEELDGLKTRKDHVGAGARAVIKNLDSLRKSETDFLHEGVSLPDGGMLFVPLLQSLPIVKLPEEFAKDKGDSFILITSLALKDGGKDVHLKSNDINLRTKANALGLVSSGYQEDIDIRTLFAGHEILEVTDEDLATFFKSGGIVVEEQKYYPNQMILLVSPTRVSGLGRFDSKQKRVVRCRNYDKTLFKSIKGRNLEQRFALELLLDDDIGLVSLLGRSGTGKTLLSLAVGLSKVNDGVYNKVIVARPVVPMGSGHEIGFLPGNKDEKLAYWMKPIADNVDFLLSEANSDETFETMLADKTIELEPLESIRGRSISNAFIIIDETQNLSLSEIKTIITRAGKGSKIVLTGDPYQIDTPYLDVLTNGLTVAVQRFKPYSISGHIVFTKGERSELATIASEILD